MRSVGHAPNVEIAGEWRPGNNGTRIDLAVLRDGVPDALIEAKQWRGFDIASWTSGAGHSNPLKKTREDIEKLRKLRNECKCYVLSFCVHSSPLPSRRYAGQFKYLEQTIRFGPISEDQIHAGFDRLRGQWRLPLATSGKFQAGRAMGVAVVVYYWLMEIR